MSQHSTCARSLASLGRAGNHALTKIAAARAFALLLPALAGAGATACGSSNAPAAPPPAAMPTYVLVHGAFMGAWAWDDVAAGLRAKGATVVAEDLPAHGADTTPVSGATLDAYVAKVVGAIDLAGSNVVLVGHSMGGVVVTQAAEQRPDKIARLVYVAAYEPANGQSLQSLSMTDSGSHLGAVFTVNPTAGTASVPASALGDVFCGDCSQAALAKIRDHYRDEPLAPLGAAVHTTAANWGRVPKDYVFTTQDHAVSYALQQTMAGAAATRKTVTLTASHSPFLSVPDSVVGALTGP
jgi:pimeloyl-ACP methyl ester carboxylesterase